MAAVPSTKGNLMKAKKSLALAQNGYELMDRKRNILIREMMSEVAEVKKLRDEISEAYATGYYLLQRANIYGGVISNVVSEIPPENHI